jgi:hypothetical protein
MLFDVAVRRVWPFETPERSLGGDFNVLNTYDYEQLRRLAGHEVFGSDGEKIGFDLVFRDDVTGVPNGSGFGTAFQVCTRARLFPCVVRRLNAA